MAPENGKWYEQWDGVPMTPWPRKENQGDAAWRKVTSLSSALAVILCSLWQATVYADLG